jgi:hypothetical protein
MQCDVCTCMALVLSLGVLGSGRAHSGVPPRDGPPPPPPLWHWVSRFFRTAALARVHAGAAPVPGRQRRPLLSVAGAAACALRAVSGSPVPPLQRPAGSAKPAAGVCVRPRVGPAVSGPHPGRCRHRHAAAVAGRAGSRRCGGAVSAAAGRGPLLPSGVVGCGVCTDKGVPTWPNRLAGRDHVTPWCALCGAGVPGARRARRVWPRALAALWSHL